MWWIWARLTQGVQHARAVMVVTLDVGGVDSTDRVSTVVHWGASLSQHIRYKDNHILLWNIVYVRYENSLELVLSQNYYVRLIITYVIKITKVV